MMGSVCFVNNISTTAKNKRPNNIIKAESLQTNYVDNHVRSVYKGVL